MSRQKRTLFILSAWLVWLLAALACSGTPLDFLFATETPTATATNTPTNTVTLTNTPTETATKTPTRTRTNTPLATVTRTATNTATPRPTLVVLPTKAIPPTVKVVASNTPSQSGNVTIHIINGVDSALDLTLYGPRYYRWNIPANSTLTVKIVADSYSYDAWTAQGVVSGQKTWAAGEWDWRFYKK